MKSHLFACLLLLVGCAHGAGRNPKTMSLQGEVLYREGMVLLEQGDLTRAEQYLASALRAHHDPDRTVQGLMTTCVRAGRLRSALGYAEPYIADHPGKLGLRLLVASLHFALQEHARAQLQLRFVLQASERTPEAHYLMAQLLTSQGDGASEAAAHYRRYLELSPRGVHAEEARAALRAAILKGTGRRVRS